MNFIKELNAFFNQIIFNPLSGSAVALWITLMHFNNRCGWKEEFSVPATMLELASGVKGSSFKRARDELQQKGYIRVKSQGGNQAAIYQMISQVQDFNQTDRVIETTDVELTNYQTNDSTDPIVDQNLKDNKVDYLIVNDNKDHTMDHSADNNTEDNPNDNPEDSTVPLIKQNNKQNKTIQKQKIITTDAINFYQENFGLVSSYVSDDMINWINDIGEPLVLHAMRNKRWSKKRQIGDM